MKAPFRRIGKKIMLAGIGLCLVPAIYGLSFGPVGYWVVNPVFQKQPCPEVYDSRLAAFLRIYDPIIHFRTWLYHHVSQKPESILSRYDALFSPSRVLANGRQVICVPVDHYQPSETPLHYFQETLGFGPSFAPKQGTQIFFLPRTHRFLAFLDKGDDDTFLILGIQNGNWDGAFPAYYVYLE